MTDPTEILEVSEACDAAAFVVAEVIYRGLREGAFHVAPLGPTITFDQVIEVASRELFDAARMVADVAMREAGVA